MSVDMSPRAITTRLKRVAQLREAWLRLAKGQLLPREPNPPTTSDAATSRGSKRKET